MPNHEPLSPTAAATLFAVLTADDATTTALRQQVRHAVVIGHRRCGCPTVDLLVNHTAVPPADGAHSVVAEGEYPPSSELPEGASVLLFAERGYLARPEIYSVSKAPITDWPVCSGLKWPASGG